MSTRIITNVQLKSPHWNEQLDDAESFCKIAASAVWREMVDSENFFEVNIVLADNAMVQRLNLMYRNQDKPTNVLSFPSGTNEHMIYGDVPSLGDIIVAFETVVAEAPTRVNEHLSHLVVHGCLHLLGYDHENVDEGDKMEALEIKILSTLGYQNPYDLNHDYLIK